MVENNSQIINFSKSIQELNVDLPNFEEKLEAGKPVVFYNVIVKLG